MQRFWLQRQSSKKGRRGSPEGQAREGTLMRIGTVMYRGRRRVGMLEGVDWRLASHENISVLDIISGEHANFEGEVALGADISVLAPLTPTTVYGIGLNYRDTVAEMRRELPTVPYLFPKLTSSVVGPYDAISFDTDVTERVDWEAELAVVIGRRCKNVPASEAHDVIFGFTVANDVTARQLDEAGGNGVGG